MNYEDRTETEVQLPTTEEGLDSFVAEITELYNLPEGDDTYDAIATMVLHLPQTKAYSTLAYFGHAVLKSMANQVAFKKLKELKKKREDKEAALLATPTESQEESSVESIQG